MEGSECWSTVFCSSCFFLLTRAPAPSSPLLPWVEAWLAACQGHISSLMFVSGVDFLHVGADQSRLEGEILPVKAGESVSGCEVLWCWNPPVEQYQSTGIVSWGLCRSSVARGGGGCRLREVCLHDSLKKGFLPFSTAPGFAHRRLVQGNVYRRCALCS